MENNYDAFISYKKEYPDSAIAEHIQRTLESYKVPAYLRRKGFPKKVNRVFLDDAELAVGHQLSEILKDSLKASNYLIVLCTLKTPASEWINIEVDYFISLGGLNNILLVLLEGSPEKSFPKSLVNKDYLALDIRESNVGKVKKKFNDEKLKVLARILGCEYSELQQRDQARRTKNLLVYSLVVTLVSLALITASIYAISQRDIAATARDDAITARNDALNMKKEAELARNNAVKSQRDAEEANAEFVRLAMDFIEHSKQSRQAMVDIFESNERRMKKVLPELINITESMEQDEKEFWKTRVDDQLSKEHLARLLGILSNERILISINDRRLIILNEAADLINSDEPKNIEKAEAMLLRAISEETRVGSFYFVLAKLYKGQKKYAEAERLLREAINIDSDIAMYHRELGFVLDLQSQTQEALSEYRAAMDLGSKKFALYAVYGSHMEKQHKPNEAIESYKKSLAFKPQNANEAQLFNRIPFIIARLYKASNDCASAIKYAEIGLSKIPNYQSGLNIIKACNEYTRAH